MRRDSLLQAFLSQSRQSLAVRAMRKNELQAKASNWSMFTWPHIYRLSANPPLSAYFIGLILHQLPL